jgi:hypothetical protein
MNEIGCMATAEALKRFDTDGDPIVLGGTKWYSKGQPAKRYKTPYGEVEILRHVYQRSQGGEIFCPLERDARIVVTSTPRFAKMVSYKFAQGASSAVRRDLMENHGRTVARSYLQNLAEAVGTVVEAKEESWQYAVPTLDQAVHSIAIELDGTCMLLREEGYQEAMAGTLSLYDAEASACIRFTSGPTRNTAKQSFMPGLSVKSPTSKPSIRTLTILGWPTGRSAIGSSSVHIPRSRYSISTMPLNTWAMPPRWLFPKKRKGATTLAG